MNRFRIHAKVGYFGTNAKGKDCFNVIPVLLIKLSNVVNCLKLVAMCKISHPYQD